MAESASDMYQVEIEFQLEGVLARDIDLLEDIGIELEEVAADTGPSAAIHGSRYSVTLVAVAESAIAANLRAAEIVIEGLNRALSKRGEALDVAAFEQLVERMLVEHAAPPALALA